MALIPFQGNPLQPVLNQMLASGKIVRTNPRAGKKDYFTMYFYSSCACERLVMDGSPGRGGKDAAPP